MMIQDRKLLTLQLDQSCEEWPVQKCRLEKRVVTKVHPDTACRKIPREVCVPNNCAMVQGEEICREEVSIHEESVLGNSHESFAEV